MQLLCENHYPNFNFEPKHLAIPYFWPLYFPVVYIFQYLIDMYLTFANLSA